MSDDDLSDDMQELNELIAEYKSLEEVNEKKQEEKITPNEESNTNVTDGAGIPMKTVLFGDKAKLIKNFKKALNQSAKQNEIVESDTDSEEKDEPKGDIKKKAKKRKPVWVDPDDEVIKLGDVKRETKHTGSLEHLRKDKSYKEYLTSRFTRIVSQPKWATTDVKETQGNEDDDELLRTVGFINQSPKGILTSGHLNMNKLRDLNRATYGEGSVNSIQFHPTSTAALVAGDAGVATIYAIDGNQNDKLHNIHIAKFPIRCARLLPCGTKAIFGSFVYNAYLYDLMTAKETCFKLKKEFGSLTNFTVSPCGRYLVSGGRCGEIHIYEAKTFEIIRTLKQNDQVASLCFTSDSQRLIVSGKSSTISIFSMRQQKLEHTFVDDGCIVGAAMDLSPNQRMLATGSMEGVVNVYDFDSVMKSCTPQPQKSFMNLTIGISSVRFNHSSELLAFCSKLSENSVKIAHFPSATVYSNFPIYNSKLGHARVLEFSPNSAYFAIGAEKACPLFRINHFQNY